MRKAPEKNGRELSVKDKLVLLRKKFREYQVDAFLVPHNDMYFNEITSPYYDRLEWLTGFSGSAGFAIIFNNSAVIFTDGRYSIQVEKEVNKNDYEIENFSDNKPFSWLKKNVNKKTTVGFDPWLHSIEEIQIQREALKEFIKLKEVDNLIDSIWLEKPIENHQKPFLRPLTLAGKSTSLKINQVNKKLKLSRENGVILTCPDSICWLANIRGYDIPNSPLMNCFAILRLNKLCIYTTKVIYKDSNVTLKKSVTLKHFDKFFLDIKKLKKVFFEPNTTPYIVYKKILVQKKKYEHIKNPITLLKSLKNPTEIRGSIRSHQKDGIALTRFLKWFKNTKTVELDEISLVNKLLNIRKAEPSFFYNSFDTISATGSNGAITHYRVSDQSNKKIETSKLVLVDSGGQYLEGTTDVTRTIIKGKPLSQQKFLYTKVLQGLICLSKLKWPKGRTGKELDPLARYFLWEFGLDYDHGTGHGVGAFSNVHQGPQGITSLNTVPLEPGMILSIEPGIYIKNKLGIRLENLVFVKEKEENFNKKKAFLEFKTLTLVPFERKLIEKKLLSKNELIWIDSYHRDVYEKLGPSLNDVEKKWLENECRVI